MCCSPQHIIDVHSGRLLSDNWLHYLGFSAKRNCLFVSLTIIACLSRTSVTVPEPLARWLRLLCLSMLQETPVIPPRSVSNTNPTRIYEEEEIVFAAIDARTEALQTLRELGPPDLVYLVKQAKATPTRQVC